MHPLLVVHAPPAIAPEVWLEVVVEHGRSRFIGPQSLLLPFASVGDRRPLLRQFTRVVFMHPIQDFEWACFSAHGFHPFD
jgi:hypothetical protein